MTTKTKATATITFDPIEIEISDGVFEEQCDWTVALKHRYDSHYLTQKAWTLTAYIVDEDALRELLMEEFMGVVNKYSHVSIDTEDFESEEEED